VKGKEKKRKEKNFNHLFNNNQKKQKKQKKELIPRELIQLNSIQFNSCWYSLSCSESPIQWYSICRANLVVSFWGAAYKWNQGAWDYQTSPPMTFSSQSLS
jgi:hypothetical protein